MKPDLEAIGKRVGKWSGMMATTCGGDFCIVADHPKRKDYFVTLFKAVWAKEEECQLLTDDLPALLEYVGELEAVMTKGQKWRRSMMTESERAVEALKCPGDSSDLKYEIAQVHRMTCESSLVQTLAALEEAP